MKIISLSTKPFAGMSNDEIRTHVHDYYRKNIQGKSVVNKHKGITIQFNRVGRRKTAKNVFNASKAALVFSIIKILEHAEYSNWQPAKESQRKNYGAVGFLNFKAKCSIDSKAVLVRIPVMQTKDMLFQYDLREVFKR